MQPAGEVVQRGFCGYLSPDAAAAAAPKCRLLPARRNNGTRGRSGQESPAAGASEAAAVPPPGSRPCRTPTDSGALRGGAPRGRAAAVVRAGGSETRPAARRRVDPAGSSPPSPAIAVDPTAPLIRPPLPPPRASWFGPRIKGTEAQSALGTENACSRVCWSVCPAPTHAGMATRRAPGSGEPPLGASPPGSRPQRCRLCFPPAVVAAFVLAGETEALALQRRPRRRAPRPLLAGLLLERWAYARALRPTR